LLETGDEFSHAHGAFDLILHCGFQRSNVPPHHIFVNLLTLECDDKNRVLKMMDFFFGTFWTTYQSFGGLLSICSTF